MGAKRERAARSGPERAEGVRAFRGIMIAVAASILLFWVPLAVVLVFLLR